VAQQTLVKPRTKGELTEFVASRAEQTLQQSGTPRPPQHKKKKTQPLWNGFYPNRLTRCCRGPNRNRPQRTGYHSLTARTKGVWLKSLATQKITFPPSPFNGGQREGRWEKKYQKGPEANRGTQRANEKENFGQNVPSGFERPKSTNFASETTRQEGKGGKEGSQER